MILGSHVGFKEQQLLGSLNEALEYDANTFMFYTGAPQNTLRRSINKVYTDKAKEVMKENNINIDNVICHAPYIINLANKEKNWDFSINFLKQEISRCDEMGIKYIVVHPGNALKEDRQVALNNIIDAVNIVLDTQNKCTILLETMAGKGSELACTLDEVKYLIDGINNKDRIGVCLDTCHLNDSGIDISKFDDYLDTFDKKIGLKYIQCVHLNDSKNELGSHKDRHENIGFGTIGFDNLINVLNNPRLRDIPFILETPYYMDKPPYKREIESLKTGVRVTEQEDLVK
jgi:deoxyribonuclease-4